MYVLHTCTYITHTIVHANTPTHTQTRMFIHKTKHAELFFRANINYYRPNNTANVAYSDILKNKNTVITIFNIIKNFK